MSNEASEYNELLDIVSDIVNAGHMDQEGLARLRAHLGYKPAALTTQRQAEPVALTAATMRLGGRYNWKQQPERLVYLGQKGSWHRFALVESPNKCWCECLDEDLSRFEETPQPSAADTVTDTQRMAWCSEHLVGVFQNVSEMFCITYLNSDGIKQATEYFNTLRQAIDSAMQKDTQ